MDRKYKRIFTEDDVRGILGRYYNRPDDEIDGLLEKWQANFPADEPVVVLRAQDNAASSTLVSYKEAARIAGAGDDVIKLVEGDHADFLEWRQRNPELCKAPD